MEDARDEALAALLEEYPGLRKMHAPGDGNCIVLYSQDATATFSSFIEPPRTVTFEPSMAAKVRCPVLKPLKCPCCGGVVESFDELTQSAKCPYCGTLLVDVPALQARFAVQAAPVSAPTPRSLSLRALELIGLGEYVEANADVEEALRMDNTAFLACYGKALLLNIGANGTAEVAHYLEKAADGFAEASEEDRAAATAAMGGACVDDAPPGVTPLLDRFAPGVLAPKVSQMLAELGASEERLAKHRAAVDAAERKERRFKLASAIVPFALLLLFFALLLSDWVSVGFKGFMLIMAFAILVVIGAMGKKR